MRTTTTEDFQYRTESKHRAFPVRTLALAAILSLPVSLPTAAQDSASSDDDSSPVATTTEEVFVEASLPYVPKANTIATKLPVELAWTPALVGVVEGAVFEEQGAQVLGDALNNVSGLNVQTGSGVFDFFVVRGFDSLNSGLILTDGAPEPETSFYQLYNAERIEVLKGPAGFLYGPNPLAGAVNIVRKAPVPARFGVLGVSAGSFDTYEGQLDLNTATDDGRIAFRVNGLWREGEAYRDDLTNEATAINPSITFRPNEDTSINVNLELASSDFTPDAGLPILFDGSLPDVPRTRSYRGPFDTSEQDIQRIQADVEHRVSDRLTLRNKTYYRDLDWLSDGTLFNGVFPGQTGRLEVFRSQVRLDDHQTIAGNQFETVWVSGRHRLLAGIELARYEDEYTLDVGVLPSIDLFAPVETAQAPFFLPMFASAGNAESTIVAPYVVDQITLSDRVQVLVGARYDDIDFEDTITRTKRSDGEVSPMLGVVVAPREGLSLYANAGRSFSPPSVRVIGERKPEESQQVEVGFRLTPVGSGTNFAVALFQIDRENIAIPDDNGFTQQAGDQRSQGLELEVAGTIGAGIRTLFAYAYTDSELTRFAEQPAPGFPVFDRSGNRSAFSPEHIANLWLSRRFGDLTIAGGARWVDDQFIAEDNRTTIDGYVLFNAAVAYSFGDWRLSLNLRNLADEDYETRGFGSSSVIPGDPFAVSFGFDYRL